MAPKARDLLPSGFTSVQDVLDEKAELRSFVNVIGIVTEYRPPSEIGGSRNKRDPDWKCQFQLYDHSVEHDETQALCFNVFLPFQKMPEANLGDVIVIRSARVQRYCGGPISLLSHHSTRIRVYDASKLGQAGTTLSAVRRTKSMDVPVPDQEEMKLVAEFHRSISKTRLPTESEFESRKIMSVNVKDKFCELRDIKDGQFADVTVQIVKKPFSQGSLTPMTLWVSDFTENEKFYNFSFAGNSAAGGQVGDPHGYLVNYQTAASTVDWTGPYGKYSMQVTCWSPVDAALISERKLTVGSWVSLRNLQIGFGKNGQNLEGFLREDRNYPDKLQITPLDPIRDPGNVTQELKDAILRKKQCGKATERALKDLAEASQAGQKRRAEMQQSADQPKRKKKTRSDLQREARRREGRELTRSALILSLNKHIKCEHDGKAASSVADILEPVKVQTVVNGDTVMLPLPFINAKYRAYVRVVDFSPNRLQDFARSRKVSETDILSDYESSSESGSDAESESVRDGGKMTSHVETTNAETVWEWRFFLRLEDAVAQEGQPKKSVWVLVDNSAAQCLLGRDASNLERDGDALEAVRERLFLLWGYLEERKARQAKKTASRSANQPPDHSSDEERGAKEQRQGQGQGPAEPSNVPFPCCISQYGVKVPEPDKTKANAGAGQRWERIFAMFGVKITPDAAEAPRSSI